MSRLARRLRRVLRLPALVLLLLATLANPVLAAVGDLHETALGTAAHLHAAQTHDTTAHATAEIEGHPGDLLHALMHAAHCCGHLTALPAELIMPLTQPSASTAPRTEPVLHLSARAAFALRPPIAG